MYVLCYILFLKRTQNQPIYGIFRIKYKKFPPTTPPSPQNPCTKNQLATLTLKQCLFFLEFHCSSDGMSVSKWLSKEKPQKCIGKWNKKDSNKFENEPPPQCNQVDQVTLTSLFELIFEEKIVSFMADITNLYVQRDKGKHNFITDSKEMLLFPAMLILTAVVLNTAISNAISGNHFKDLLSVLHLSKNLQACQIQVFYEVTVCHCFQFWPNSEDLSVDESILLYCGRNNSKQQIQNKCVRSRFEMWVLAELLGYVVNFDPYQGAKFGNTTRATDRTWVFGEMIVLSFLDVLPQNMFYRVFMDNFFTSLYLLKFLILINIGASGTVREN